MVSTPLRGALLDEIGDRMVDARVRFLRAKHQSPRTLAAMIGAGVVTAALLAALMWAAGRRLGELLAPAPDALGRAAVTVWTTMIQPLIVEPVAAWFRIYASGLPVAAGTLAALWLALGCGLYALASTRSVYARVAWPVYGAATVVAGFFGAQPPTHGVVAAGAIAAAWLILSLIPYSRTRPATSVVSYGQVLRKQIEDRQQLLTAAAPGSDAEQQLRQQLATDVEKVLQEQRERGRRLLEELDRSEIRFTAGVGLGSVAGFAAGFLFVGLGATALGVLVILAGAAGIAFAIADTVDAPSPRSNEI